MVVEVFGGRGKPSTLVDKDEGFGKFDAAKLRKLRPSFKPSEGTVTAGNASSISDDAVALVPVSGENVLELELHEIADMLHRHQNISPQLQLWPYLKLFQILDWMLPE